MHVLSYTYRLYPQPVPYRSHTARTVIFMPGEVLCINDKVVVRVKLPKLAVDDVEVFIGEEISDLVDIGLVLQQCQDLKEAAPAKFTGRDTTVPVTIHNIEYPTDHLGEHNHRQGMKYTPDSHFRNEIYEVYNPLNRLYTNGS